MKTDVEIYDPRSLYDEIPTEYDHVADKYFPFAAERIVELAEPAAGDLVLDVACGSGPITRRAARRVGPEGWAVGVDISRGMLGAAARRAASDGIFNASFMPADFHALPFPPAWADRVLCGFAIFFAEDPAAVTRDLWARVKPGGTLVISSLAEDFFSPPFDILLDAIDPAVVDLRPLLPSQKMATADHLADIVERGGVPNAEVIYESTEIPLPSIDGFWEIANGTGIRRVTKALAAGGGEAAVTAARAHVNAEAARRSIRSARLGINYAVARRPR